MYGAPRFSLTDLALWIELTHAQNNGAISNECASHFGYEKPVRMMSSATKKSRLLKPSSLNLIHVPHSDPAVCAPVPKYDMPL